MKKQSKTGYCVHEHHPDNGYEHPEFYRSLDAAKSRAEEILEGDGEWDAEDGGLITFVGNGWNEHVDVFEITFEEDAQEE